MLACGGKISEKHVDLAQFEVRFEHARRACCDDHTFCLDNYIPYNKIDKDELRESVVDLEYPRCQVTVWGLSLRAREKVL